MKFIIQITGELHERHLKSCRLPVTGYRLRALLLGFCFFSSVSFVTHPYYMSVTEFEYKSKEKEIQIACKIFTDDLQEALRQASNERIDLNNSADSAKNKKILAGYLNKHLGISINKKPLQITFIGCEQEGEATWSYLLVKNVPAFKKATVLNDLLYQYRKDQINIVHFINNGNRKSYRISFPAVNYEFSW